MTNTDPASLDRLNDFVLPDPVGFWPLAPVWKFVIALVMVWLAAWVWICLVKYIRNAYRRVAITELDLIEADRDLVKLNELLKRTAMSAYGRDSVASLYGEKWTSFLNDSLVSPPSGRVERSEGRAEHEIHAHPPRPEAGRPSQREGEEDGGSAARPGEKGTIEMLAPIKLLADASTQPSSIELSEQERIQLFAFARGWIRHHEVDTSSC